MKKDLVLTYNTTSSATDGRLSQRKNWGKGRLSLKAGRWVCMRLYFHKQAETAEFYNCLIFCCLSSLNFVLFNIHLFDFLSLRFCTKNGQNRVSTCFFL